MKMIRRVTTGTFAVAALLLGASQAQADHDLNIIEAKAEALRTVMTDLDRTFVYSYVRSRVFGEIMATSGQIKGKSAHLRVMAKYGHPCKWRYEIDALDELVCRLTRLVQEAHYRARHGLDPPIYSCRDTVQQQLDSMSAIVQCMRDALDTAPVVVAPRPERPIYNYAPQLPPQTLHYRGNRSKYGHNPYIKHAENYGRHPYDRGNVHFDRGGLTLGSDKFSFRINF